MKTGLPAPCRPHHDRLLAIVLGAVVAAVTLAYRAKLTATSATG
jgi:hypothetical protein